MIARGSQVVRREIANLLFDGSIPSLASIQKKDVDFRFYCDIVISPIREKQSKGECYD